MNGKDFYFYDLETTGLNSRHDRIMQFGGQRTDSNLNPIGEPDNILIKLYDDVLPNPGAVMVHGVTPQDTAKYGITEPEFFRKLVGEIFSEDTIIVGFNNIRFDDEFVRHGLWRNLVDPYEWAYSKGRSRWDIIDLVRMCRAVRPEGIKWPFTKEGKPSNRLEEITKANGIFHENAHDALSDVLATISVAGLIKEKHPKLFEYHLSMSNKLNAKQLLSVEEAKPIVHTSGKLSSEHLKTSIFLPIAYHPEYNSMVIAYDLRYDPGEFTGLDEESVYQAIFTPKVKLKEKGLNRLPIKGIYVNRSPAVAPLSVLRQEDWQRLSLDKKEVSANQSKVAEASLLIDNVLAAYKKHEFGANSDPDDQLYEGFIPDKDKMILVELSKTPLGKIIDTAPKFSDERLQTLWFRYKARNFPDSLTPFEKEQWQEFRNNKLTANFVGFSKELEI